MRSCGPCHYRVCALPQPWIKNTCLVLFIFKDWVVVLPKCFPALMFPTYLVTFRLPYASVPDGCIRNWGLMKVCFSIPSLLCTSSPAPACQPHVFCLLPELPWDLPSPSIPLCSRKHTWHMCTHAAGMSCTRHVAPQYFSLVVLPLGPVNTYYSAIECLSVCIIFPHRGAFSLPISSWGRLR